MQLFALTEEDLTPSIYNINVDKKTSGLIKTVFNNMEADFNNAHNETIPFTADYKLDKNEFFILENFKEHNALKKALKTPKGVPNLHIDRVPLNKIKALFTGSTDGKKITIQRFDNRQVLTPSTMLFLDSKETFSHTTYGGISIGSKITALIHDDTITFGNFNTLRRVFNMDAYFRDATDSELDSFQDNGVFATETGFKLSSFDDTAIRRKVTLLNQAGILEVDNIPNLIIAAQELKHPLETKQTNNGVRIVMPIEKRKIKLLLDFLDSDIYISAVNGKKYRSNSKRQID
ncbi:Kiwa anti-phage protein KwaB-like domain-containing protein [Dickeya dadantii subsp. dieffenbachiae]|uniref:Kiwa anti-phage protein KwaB-like domain-containing protein n=1 Tax=Dickeya dadantii TaxID=204038 RepID=UPI00039EDF7B|nr:Kiwa anti-phage protein KwaB-like domain-containing protein [Dickeya dadantii]